jgi:hypothetical protein
MHAHTSEILIIVVLMVSSYSCPGSLFDTFCLSPHLKVQHENAISLLSCAQCPANDVSYPRSPSQSCRSTVKSSSSGHSDEETQTASGRANLRNLADFAHSALVLGVILHAVVGA